MVIKREDVTIEGVSFPVYSMNTLIVGSGAAGLNAAQRLFEYGQRDIALVTDHWGGGTSFNAGSDKQTFYKLSLAGSVPDSPRIMADDFVRGGCMHGDIALCEAQHSAEMFFRLVALGVPFPHDRYGGYVGYRTDHAAGGRATSAGPLTSRMICEYLGRSVCDKGIPILDNHDVVALLCEREQGRKRVCGAVAIDRSAMEGERCGFVLFNARNVVLATGGPGGMYDTSVYPESQTGSTGMALSVGATAQNLTESQFGIASVGFRWNLSGSYQQVIPRYYSTDRRGGDSQEFLNRFFPDMKSLAGAIFRKGYEWPFDTAKVANHGSSLIDLLVYRETVRKGRRVFLDFRRNPSRSSGLGDFSLDVLDGEAHSYLEKSKALLPTPIERLSAMNPQAVDLFRDNGIDLTGEPLEIALCAQHCNGGLKGNLWWESNIAHLFPIGEVCGTHGVRRPGGAALNSGQVGGARAALFIAQRYGCVPLDAEDFAGRTRRQVRECLEFAQQIRGRGGDGELVPEQVLGEIRERMSVYGAAVRDRAAVTRAAEEAWWLYGKVRTGLCIVSHDDLVAAFRVADLCLTHAVTLDALKEYLDREGGSRGSAFVLNPEGELPNEKLGGKWSFRLADPDDFVSSRILEIDLDEELNVRKRWVDIRPVPEEDGWFEKVWSDYIEDRIFVEESEGE
jgi:succinate dehydrogenase/fumarate reductase flavoprotein subunit